MEPPDNEIGNKPAPASPIDHAAGAVFGADRMAGSRQMLRQEHGWAPSYNIRLIIADFCAQKGADGYRRDGESGFSRDIASGLSDGQKSPVIKGP